MSLIKSSPQVAIPVYVRHSLSWLGGTQGRFDITVGPKQTMGRTVEKVFSRRRKFSGKFFLSGEDRDCHAQVGAELQLEPHPGQIQF